MVSIGRASACREKADSTYRVPVSAARKTWVRAAVAVVFPQCGQVGRARGQAGEDATGSEQVDGGRHRVVEGHPVQPVVQLVPHVAELDRAADPGDDHLRVLGVPGAEGDAAERLDPDQVHVPPALPQVLARSRRSRRPVPTPPTRHSGPAGTISSTSVGQRRTRGSGCRRDTAASSGTSGCRAGSRDPADPEVLVELQVVRRRHLFDGRTEDLQLDPQRPVDRRRADDVALHPVPVAGQRQRVRVDPAGAVDQRVTGPDRAGLQQMPYGAERGVHLHGLEPQADQVVADPDRVRVLDRLRQVVVQSGFQASSLQGRSSCQHSGIARAAESDLVRPGRPCTSRRVSSVDGSVITVAGGPCSTTRPASITRTSSATAPTRPRSWLIQTSAVPCCLQLVQQFDDQSRCRCSSSAVVISSQISTSGAPAAPARARRVAARRRTVGWAAARQPSPTLRAGPGSATASSLASRGRKPAEALARYGRLVRRPGAPFVERPADLLPDVLDAPVLVGERFRRTGSVFAVRG